MAKEKTKLEKNGWSSSFTLVGKAIVNDRTYKLEQRSQNSDWISNRLNLGVNCGEKNGTVYCEMWGGYGENRENKVYVHGKKDDGTDDFQNQYIISWEDRLDEEIISGCGRMCFTSVALEKTSTGALFYKNFLSPYDAIDYINEHLVNGMRVKVSGNLKYSVYNDTVQVRKEITRIAIANDDDIDSAKFTQSMLLTKDSFGTIDKKTGFCPIDAIVLEYFKNYNGYEVNGNVPLHKTFEFDFNKYMNSPENMKKIKDLCFTVKKGVTEIKFEGEFIESGSTTKITEDDLSEDVKLMIAMGMRTMEEALKDAAGFGSVVRRMVLTRPVTKVTENEDGSKKVDIDKIERRYEETDLVLDCLTKKEELDMSKFDMPVPEIEHDEESWLTELGL